MYKHLGDAMSLIVYSQKDSQKDLQMVDQTSQGTPGIVTITWDDGSVEVYHLPADAIPDFSHDEITGVMKFRAHDAGSETGIVRNYTFNFNKMRKYDKSWM